MGLLDELLNLNVGGLLNYDQRAIANQQAQAELNTRLNRDFTSFDYYSSSDPYTQAVRDNNIPERGLLSFIPQGVNSAKNYIADMISGQAPITHEAEAIQRKQYIESLPVEERPEAVTQDATINALDWTPATWIGGPKAKNANHNALKVAKEMKKQGYTADEIFRATTDLKNYPNQTGWNLDFPDGVPRFESSDKGVKLKPVTENWEKLTKNKLAEYEKKNPKPKPKDDVDIYDLDDIDEAYEAWRSKKTGYKTSIEQGMLKRNRAIETEGMPLHQFMDNEQVYQNYPEVANINVYGDPLEGGAFYDVAGNRIVNEGFNTTPKLLRTMAHETQHPIQHIEGMGVGGSPINYGAQQYHDLLGESEARLVPERLDYSMDERLLLPFYEAYDVPFKDMIIRRDGLLNASQEATKKLFHGTTKENAENIFKDGFILSENQNPQRLRKTEGNIGYGFDNYNDAEDFALNQGFDSQAVISFEVPKNSIYLDPEYGDSAFYFDVIPENILKIWDQ